MRSLEETRTRWKDLLENATEVKYLRASIANGPSPRSPCERGLRSICWKIFLLFHTVDTQTWCETLDNTRSAYTSLKAHYTKNLNNSEDISADDPLSDNDENSPWNILRQDEELRAEIFQDVERCMPDYAIFREPETQSILLDILFVYCKLNRDISYRQGMHEVLAPIFWVVHCDAVSQQADETSQLAHEKHGDTIRAVLDAKFIEHDAFTLFGAVMRSVKAFYEMSDSNVPKSAGPSAASPIVERSKRIHENYLHHADPELAEHLISIEILPQIFLIRWIRLIFGREFPFEQVLTLWDALFAEDPGLDLVDYVSVSMLLRIRWQLMEADYTAALTLLLRYPVPDPPHGPATFVSDALYLRDNLMLDGGAHLIAKYSRKAPETTVTRKLPKKVKRARTNEQKEAQSASAAAGPRTAPTNPKSILEHGSLEGMLQEAAKEVYLRGEKWGVTKALRGAVQGLQAVNNISPQRNRPSRGNMTAETSLEAKLSAQDARNRTLSKMLEQATHDLWAFHEERAHHPPPDTNDLDTLEKDARQASAVQKVNGSNDEGEPKSDLLSLAIAKVQLVQVYLDNPGMALPAEDGASEVAREDHGTSKQLPAPPVPPKDESSLEEKVDVAPTVPSDPPAEALDATHTQNAAPLGLDGASDIKPAPSRTRPKYQHKISLSSTESVPAVTISATDTSTTPTPSTPPPPSTTAQPETSSPQPRGIRAPIAESPFSWMLGDSNRHGKTRSSKARASDSGSPASGILHGKEGGEEGKGSLLFGDARSSSSGGRKRNTDGRNSMAKGCVSGVDDDGEDDVFGRRRVKS